MEKPVIKIKKVREEAKIPSKNKADAGYDLYGVFDKDPVFLYPGDIYLVPLGICTQFPQDYVFYIVERSSSGAKGISTRAGVIDSGFRGEIKTPLNNTTNKLIIFSEKAQTEILQNYPEKVEGYEENILVYPQGKAIAQGLLLHCPHAYIEETEDLGNSERGSGGFGSTGR